MRVLIINSVCGVMSTGRIATEIAENYISQGYEVVIAYGREEVPEKYKDISKKITKEYEVRINGLMSRLYDNEGLNAKATTKRFLKWADAFDPDIVWLHNLHGYYINYELLFSWIKKRPQMEVKWTLHDCWAFTGHCAYFSYVGCDYWKTGCHNCVQKNSYPKSVFLDRSERNYVAKQQAFTSVENMSLITPSYWLASLVADSFLNNYAVEVRRNTISPIFKPRPSNIKDRLNIHDKFIILGIAAQWSKRKGLDDFVELSKMIDDNYIIVLVGLNKEQIQSLPDRVLGLERTNSVDELVELYSAANVFFNPTYEDNYPTTNLEAQACGTAAITYNTGGSPESVPTENVVEPGDVKGALNRIIAICNSK